MKYAVVLSLLLLAACARSSSSDDGPTVTVTSDVEYGVSVRSN